MRELKQTGWLAYKGPAGQRDMEEHRLNQAFRVLISLSPYFSAGCMLLGQAAKPPASISSLSSDWTGGGVHFTSRMCSSTMMWP